MSTNYRDVLSNRKGGLDWDKDPKKPDTYLLKVNGKAESPERIKVGHNYRLMLEGSVVSESMTDNNDGSYTYTGTFKPVRMEAAQDNGETLKLKDTRSRSQPVTAVQGAVLVYLEKPE